MPLLSPTHKICAQRVSLHVTGNGVKILVVLYRERLESPLVNMPVPVGRRWACHRWVCASANQPTNCAQLHAQIMDAGREAGFTRDALRRAKERIGVTAHRDGFGPGSRFYWRLNGAS